MLGKPFAGWSHIEVNGRYVGTGSYLDWIPGIVIEACVRYLREAEKDIKRWGYSPGGYGFNIMFDAEGWNFGITEIGDDFYTYDTKGEKPPYVRLEEIDLRPYNWDGSRFIRAILKEAAADIKRDFEDWVIWDAYDSEDEKNNRKALKELLKKAERYGNNE